MFTENVYRTLILVELGLALVTFVFLLGFKAPYGRHARAGFGPAVNARLGWFLMEWPAVFWVIALYVSGPQQMSGTALALLGLFQIHYLNRTLVYPLRLQAPRPMPLVVALSGMGFQLLNGTIISLSLSHFSNYSDGEWLSPRFVCGALVFLSGFFINLRADASLRRLREEGRGYVVPHGFLYRWVSCPNYLGEIVEWGGFALAAWSLPAVAFFAFTLANLVPRALAHHRWYQEQFLDYPRSRRAVFPGIL